MQSLLSITVEESRASIPKVHCSTQTSSDRILDLNIAFYQLYLSFLAINTRGFETNITKKNLHKESLVVGTLHDAQLLTRSSLLEWCTTFVYTFFKYQGIYRFDSEGFASDIYIVLCLEQTL